MSISDISKEGDRKIFSHNSHYLANIDPPDSVCEESEDELVEIKLSDSANIDIGNKASDSLEDQTHIEPKSAVAGNHRKIGNKIQENLKKEFRPIISDAQNPIIFTRNPEKKITNEIIVISEKGVMLQPKILSDNKISNSHNKFRNNSIHGEELDQDVQPVITRSNSKINKEKSPPTSFDPFYYNDSDWSRFNENHEFVEIENMDGSVCSRDIPIQDTMTIMSIGSNNLSASSIEESKSSKFIGDLRRERANSLDLSIPSKSPLLTRRRFGSDATDSQYLQVPQLKI